MKQPPPVIPTLLGHRVASEEIDGSSGIKLDSEPYNGGEPSNGGGGNTRIHNMYMTNSNGGGHHNVESSLHLSSDQGAGNGVHSLH